MRIPVGDRPVLIPQVAEYNALAASRSGTSCARKCSRHAPKQDRHDRALDTGTAHFLPVGADRLGDRRTWRRGLRPTCPNPSAIAAAIVELTGHRRAAARPSHRAWSRLPARASPSERRSASLPASAPERRQRSAASSVRWSPFSINPQDHVPLRDSVTVRARGMARRSRSSRSRCSSRSSSPPAMPVMSVGGSMSGRDATQNRQRHRVLPRDAAEACATAFRRVARRACALLRPAVSRPA